VPWPVRCGRGRWLRAWPGERGIRPGRAGRADGAVRHAHGVSGVGPAEVERRAVAGDPPPQAGRHQVGGGFAHVQLDGATVPVAVAPHDVPAVEAGGQGAQVGVLAAHGRQRTGRRPAGCRFGCTTTPSGDRSQNSVYQAARGFGGSSSSRVSWSPGAKRPVEHQRCPVPHRLVSRTRGNAPDSEVPMFESAVLWGRERFVHKHWFRC
jgi:hypothetical protein